MYMQAKKRILTDAPLSATKRTKIIQDSSSVVCVNWDGVITNHRVLRVDAMLSEFQREDYLMNQDIEIFSDALDALLAIQKHDFKVVVVGRISRRRLEKERKNLLFTFDSDHSGQDFPSIRTSGEVFYVSCNSVQCDEAQQRYCHLNMKAISVTSCVETASELEHHHSIVCNSLTEVADYIVTDTPKLPLRYLFSGYYGCERLQLHKYLRGWSLISAAHCQQFRFIDYIRHEHTKQMVRDKSLYGIQCTLKNVLDETGLRSVINKHNLYFSMASKFADYLEFMPQSWDIHQKETVDPGEILIVKPVGPGACAGHGISVVASTEELGIAWEKIRKNSKWKQVIVSNYIRNPLLFQGLKFHMRCYLIVTSWGKCQPFCQADILTARSLYKPEDFQNTDIHDSHGKSTLRDCFFPEDWPSEEEKDLIQKGINKIMERIVNLIEDKCTLSPYSESKYGYEILAPDIMFDNKFQPYLLEVNSRVGYGAVCGVNKYYHEWERGFLDWEYETAIKPCFVCG